MFKYTPLRPNLQSIRLAIILPASKHDEIELELIESPLSTAPPYEALSYAWGTPDNSHTAFINGQKVVLSSALGLALRYLRDESNKRIMWIDAICINQADVEERNSQVAFMSTVYSQAVRAVIWLGAQDPTSDKAMDFLREMARNPAWWEDLWTGRRKRVGGTRRKRDRGRGSKMRLEYPNFGLIPGEDLSSGEEEELVRDMNKSDIVKRNGRNYFSREEYFDAVSPSTTESHRSSIPPNDHNGNGVFHVLSGYWTDCCGDPYNNRLPFFRDRDSDWEALDELLLRPWFSRTWVLQEVWAAPKAILQCGNKVISWNSFSLAMSYNESWDEIGESFINAARKSRWDTLKRRYGLAIHMSNKSLMGSTLSDVLWNTWDRECSDPRDKVFAIMGLVKEDQRGSVEIDYGKDFEQLYKEVACEIITTHKSLDILLAASGPTDVENIPSWVPDWRCEANLKRPTLFVNRTKLHSIYVGGSMTGTVVMYGHGFQASGSNPAIFSFNQTRDVLRVSCVLIDTIAVLDKAYPEKEVELITSSACKLASTRKLSDGVVNIRQEVEIVLAAGRSSPYYAMEDTAVIGNVMRNRCFFITRSGHMCTGPAYSKEGDVVSIIAGCNFPIILRPEEDHYILVGEAYRKWFTDIDLSGALRTTITDLYSTQYDEWGSCERGCYMGGYTDSLMLLL